MGWIGVDLDGTLAVDTGWKGIDHIGEPIPAMVDRVKGWLDDGKEVRILTARMADNPKAAEPIKAWCKKHLGHELVVTCEKDPELDCLWDDKAVGVEKNKGTKAESIAEMLLGEDLETKLPLLLKQFPEYTEAFIRQLAGLDPTHNKTYITWLLRLHRAHPEDVPLAEPQRMLDALALFDQKKNRRGFVGKRDIMAYSTGEAFFEMVEGNRSDGLEVIREHGDLRLHHVTTVDAARKLAVGLGHHVNKPTTTWCTIGEYWGTEYTGRGVLLTVTKNMASYVQVYFPENPQDNLKLQAHNPQNQDISLALAREIAPLFTHLPQAEEAWQRLGVEYKPATAAIPAHWVVRPDKVERTLENYRTKFFNERWLGFKPKCKACRGTGVSPAEGITCRECEGTGEIDIPPFRNLDCPQCHGTRQVAGEDCPDCLDLLEQRWQKRKPIFLEIFERAIDENNTVVLHNIATLAPGVPAYTPKGAQALYNVTHPQHG